MTDTCHRDYIVYHPIEVKHPEYVNTEKLNWWLLRLRLRSGLLGGWWSKCAAWLEQSSLQLTLVSGHVDHQLMQTPSDQSAENKWLLSAESYMEHLYQYAQRSRHKEHHESGCAGVMMWDSTLCSLCAMNVLLPLINKEASFGLRQGRL